MVTLPQRIEAQAIVLRLLETFTAGEVAAKLGIRRIYVLFTASLQQQSRAGKRGFTVRYLTPVKTIQAILEWSQNG